MSGARSGSAASDGEVATGEGAHDPLLDDFDENAHSLVDLVNRVLDRGVVITGHVTISVAGVDLVYLGLNAVLTSLSTSGGPRPRLPEASTSGTKRESIRLPGTGASRRAAGS